MDGHRRRVRNVGRATDTAPEIVVHGAPHSPRVRDAEAAVLALGRAQALGRGPFSRPGRQTGSRLTGCARGVRIRIGSPDWTARTYSGRRSAKAGKLSRRRSPEMSRSTVPCSARQGEFANSMTASATWPSPSRSSRRRRTASAMPPTSAARSASGARSVTDTPTGRLPTRASMARRAVVPASAERTGATVFPGLAVATILAAVVRTHARRVANSLCRSEDESDDRS